MKIIPILLSLLLACHLMAADSHQHKIIHGPQGGKMLESEPLHTEFFVLTDRKVSLTFYSDANKPIAPTGQEVKVIAETKTGKVALEFEKRADRFLSKTALPEGDGYRLIIQIKNDASAKPQNFRLNLNTATCSECKRAEYACTCEHTDGTSH